MLIFFALAAMSIQLGSSRKTVPLSNAAQPAPHPDKSGWFHWTRIHTIVDERLGILESYYEATYFSGWLSSAGDRLRLDKTAILRETCFALA